MSRKRDTNWSKDEIATLLESVMEINRNKNDGRRVSSRELFDYAAKRMADNGHTARAEKDKCRTKWKKMKEEYTYAKKAREGDTRYKEAPGIQPFYEKMEQFMNGNYGTVPEAQSSAIPRKGPSLGSPNKNSPTTMRSSARIAAVNGMTISPNDSNSEVVIIRASNNNDYSSNICGVPHTTRQNNRLIAVNNGAPMSAPLINGDSHSVSDQPRQQGSNSHTHHNQRQLTTGGPEVCTVYASFDNANVSTADSLSNNHTNGLATDGGDTILIPASEQADISYRVSTGSRQITIFGDHDVDIKFRGDCVTINKIDGEYNSTGT